MCTRLSAYLESPLTSPSWRLPWESRQDEVSGSSGAQPTLGVGRPLPLWAFTGDLIFTLSFLLSTWLCCGHGQAATPGASWVCIPTLMGRSQDHWGPQEARDWGESSQGRARWQCGGRGAASGAGGEDMAASYSPLRDPTEPPSYLCAPQESPRGP